MKKYSFVIPTYNKKELLRRTLEFINLQKYYPKGEYEVIVVDDGSNDGTSEYIKDMDWTYSLKYIYLERDIKSCRSKARNVGWSKAEGDIIIFLDDDILINEEYLNELDRYYAIDESLLVLGTRLNLPQNKRDECLCDWSSITEEAYKTDNSSMLEARHITLKYLSYNASYHRFPWVLAFSCNMVIPKIILEKYGGFDEDFKDWGYEDIELGYRLFKKGVKIVINSKLEVLHQYHQKSLEGKNNLMQFKSKCPYAFEELPTRKGFEVFVIGTSLYRYSISKKDYKVNRDDIKMSRIIDFVNINQLDDIKKEIIQLSEENGIEIIVNDYLEDTNLDLWIQLLGVRNSTPMYFPKSKVIYPQRKNIINNIDEIISSKGLQRAEDT